MTEELIKSGMRQAAKARQLQDAVARQLAKGETLRVQQDNGGEHLAVTDRRLIITKVGNWLGERSHSVVLSAISSIDTHVDDGRIILIQLSVPGRTWGEIAFTGKDLGPVYEAIVSGLPRHGAPA